MSLEKLELLRKALEAGIPNAAPSSLTQGAALQMEDLSDVMNVATIEDPDLKLSKTFKVKPAKGTMVQFVRQLSYGIIGGSAVGEGAVGQEETSDYVRAIVPMAYYVHLRRTTLQSQLIEAFDGVKAEDRVENDAALKLSIDIEFHTFRGHADYSNAGVFDGNPMAMANKQPGMHGLDPQIRQSDFLTSTQDLMFNEYGGDIPVVVSQNGPLSQPVLDDIYAISQMHNGRIKVIYIDPLTHASYNKLGHAKERIILAGSAQSSTGSSLTDQFVVGGSIKVESSRFLSAKTSPARPRVNTPAAPSISAAAVASASAFDAGTYTYKVTACNEVGEGVMSSADAQAVAGPTEKVELTITPAGGLAANYFNVYRSFAGESRTWFIGKVKANGASAVIFTDLNNRLPRSITGFALDDRGMEMAELSSFKSVELGRVDLTTPKAFFRFCAVMAKLPRFNMLVDNITQ